MDGDKLISLQMQVKQNSQEMMNYINDLNSWEDEIKVKEEGLKNDKITVKQFPPVRSKLKKKKNIQNDKNSQNKKIKSWDYKAWDKFDVAFALMKRAKNGSGHNNISRSQVVHLHNLQEPLTHERKFYKDKACEEIDKSEEEEEMEDMVEVKVNSLREQGNEHFKQGRHNEALSCYTQALLLDPCNSVLLSNRAMAYLKLEKYELAENDCSKAIDFDTENVKAYMRRGKARQSLKKYKEAKEDFTEVLRMEPQNKFCKECLQEITKIIDSKNLKHQSCRSSENDVKEKGIVMPITKPASERSKKPLKRITIEEIGLDPILISNPNKTHEDESFQRFLSADAKQSTNIKQENEKDTNIAKQEATPTPTDNTLNEMSCTKFTSPANSYQFQVDWNMLKNKDLEFFQYLKMIDTASFKQIFGEAFDSDILSKIISVLHQYYDDADAYSILKCLGNVKRFSMNVKFLSLIDNKKLEEIFEKLSKIRPDGDIELLRSLYK